MQLLLNLLLLLLQIVGLLLLGLGLLGLVLWINSRKYRHLPGDFGLPIIGNLRACFRTLKGGPHRIWLRTNEESEKFGKVFYSCNGPIMGVMIADPDLIKQLSFDPAIVDKEWLAYRGMRYLLGGAFTKSESDAEWKYYRKLMNKSLRKEKLESFLDIFTRKSQELVGALRLQKGVFNTKHIALLHTTDLLTETNLGLESHELDNMNIGLGRDLERLVAILDEVISNPIWFAFPQLYLWYKAKTFKHLNDFEKRFYEALMKKLELAIDEDISQGVEMLINGIKMKYTAQQTLRDLRELIIVGSETTAETIALALLFLGVYPEVQDKAFKEQEEIFQGLDRLPTPDDVKNMKYLRMVVKDTTRFVGGPLFPRRCKKETKLGEYRIPANTTILVGSFKVRTDPKYWEKTTFWPENYSPENVLARPKGVDTTFGIQPRNCPGAEYAILASMIALSAVIRNFKIHTDQKPEEIYDRYAGIIFHHKKEYLISCEPRVPSIAE